MKRILDRLNYNLTELLDSMKTAHKHTTTQTHLSPAPDAPLAPYDHWISAGINDYLEVILDIDEPDLLFLTNINNYYQLISCTAILTISSLTAPYSARYRKSPQKIATEIINSAVNNTMENASNNVCVEHLYDEERWVEMEANLHETDKETLWVPGTL